MLTIGMNYDVLPGKEDAFEAAARKIVHALEAGGSGHVSTDLYRRVDAPASYLILSEWASEEDFHRFVRSPTFAKVTDWGAREILAGRPRHRTYASPSVPHNRRSPEAAGPTLQEEKRA